MMRRPARPPSKLTPARCKDRALDPVRRNRRVGSRSMRWCTASRIAGTRCTSSITTHRSTAVAFSVACRRSGSAANVRATGPDRRSSKRASGKHCCAYVDFPVPLGPKRKVLRVGAGLSLRMGGAGRIRGGISDYSGFYRPNQAETAADAVPSRVTPSFGGRQKSAFPQGRQRDWLDTGRRGPTLHRSTAFHF